MDMDDELLRVAPWPAILPFIEALEASAELGDASAIATDDATLRRVARSFCNAAERLDVRLDPSSPGFVRSWPQGLEEREGSVSIDSFVAELLTPDASSEALAVLDSPLVELALGALWTVWLMDHRAGVWLGGPIHARSEELLPTSIRLGTGQSVAFPFAHAREALLQPMSGLWSKAITFADASPPRGLAGTFEDARRPSVLDQLLPPGGSALLGQIGTLSPAVILDAFERIAEQHDQHATWWRIGSSLAFQAGDIHRAVACARRAAELHDNVMARYHLGDILSCAEEPELLEQAIGVLDEVLREQPMMVRAAIKRAHALLDLGRDDQAIVGLRAVAEQAYGADADQARALLEELGALEPEP